VHKCISKEQDGEPYPQDPTYTVTCLANVGWCSAHTDCSSKFGDGYCCGLWLKHGDEDYRPEYHSCLWSEYSNTTRTIHGEDLVAVCMPTYDQCITSDDCDSNFCCAELSSSVQGQPVSLQGCANIANNKIQQKGAGWEYTPTCLSVPCAEGSTTCDALNNADLDLNYCCGSMTTINNVGFNETVN